MGTSVSVFGFLIVFLAFAAPRFERLVDGLTNIDISSVSFLIMGAVAAWAAGDAYRTFTKPDSKNSTATFKMAGILLFVQVLIFTAFDLIQGQETQFARLLKNTDGLLSVTISWLMIFAVILAGFSFGNRPRNTNS